uniref:Uncharacterized protein n=1 Tax=Calidris pygmaea TaxID=425635 RepID=A0A8C3J4I6_9CHAR
GARPTGPRRARHPPREVRESRGCFPRAPGPTRARQGESCQAKRSPSSPQGGPKKRSAFGDITNVSASVGLGFPPRRKNFFTKRVAKHWNRLLRAVVESLCLQEFRRPVDMALRDMV